MGDAAAVVLSDAGAEALAAVVATVADVDSVGGLREFKVHTSAAASTALAATEKRRIGLAFMLATMT